MIYVEELKTHLSPVRYAIWTGTSGLPPAKEAAYRARWRGDKPTKPAKPQVLGFGPGTELLALWGEGELAVKPPPQCDCKEYAQQMDRWGVAGCRDRLGEIVGHLSDAFARWSWGKRLWTGITVGVKAAWNGLPLSLEGMVEEAIRRAEVKEQERAQKKSNAAPEVLPTVTPLP